MATHNPITQSASTEDAAYAASDFELQARLDGFLDADGFFVGPPDEIDFADLERHSDGASHA